MSLPLLAALAQCERHAQLMTDAMGKLPAHWTPQLLEAADEQTLLLLDRFVLRYSKLQDTLSAHVLRAFAVQILREPVEDAVLADVLNLLEKHSFLTANDWAQQREIRNALTHEYPEDTERQAAALSAAQLAAKQLSAWLSVLVAKSKI